MKLTVQICIGINNVVYFYATQVQLMNMKYIKKSQKLCK